MKRVLLSTLFLALTPACGYAQTPSQAAQALSACMTRSTTAEDNVVLLRWIFVALARHPSLTQLANIPDSERVSANRQMGALVNRLLLEACPSETRAAIQSDGQRAFETPFEALGRSAMGGIMSHADVNASIAEFASYVDQQRLAALVGEQAQ